MAWHGPWVNDQGRSKTLSPRQASCSPSSLHWPRFSCTTCTVWGQGRHGDTDALKGIKVEWQDEEGGASIDKTRIFYFRRTGQYFKVGSPDSSHAWKVIFVYICFFWVQMPTSRSLNMHFGYKENPRPSSQLQPLFRIYIVACYEPDSKIVEIFFFVKTSGANTCVHDGGQSTQRLEKNVLWTGLS